jgi:hypothetical protein
MTSNTRLSLNVKQTAALIEKAKREGDGDALAIARFLHHEVTNASRVRKIFRPPSWWRKLLAAATGR